MAAMQVDGLLFDGATQEIDVGVVGAGLSAAHGGKGLAAAVALPFERIAPVTVDEVRAWIEEPVAIEREGREKRATTRKREEQLSARERKRAATRGASALASIEKRAATEPRRFDLILGNLPLFPFRSKKNNSVFCFFEGG